MPDRTQSALSCLLALLLLTFVNACATTSSDDIEVTSEWAPGVITDIGRYYDWYPTLDEVRPIPVDPEMDAFVRQVIERELSNRGYSKRPGQHKFQVAYDLGTRTVLDSPFMGADVKEQGALAIMVIDPGKEIGIWRGIAKASVQPSLSPSDRRARIQRAARSILAKLPRAGR